MDNFLIYDEILKKDYCTVYRGRIKRSIDFVMIYCVEKFKRHELSNLVRLMYELDHPNIMKFREWYETTNHLWLVMDLCDGMPFFYTRDFCSCFFICFLCGSLKTIIVADGSLPEQSIRSIGTDICQGLYYLHQQDMLFCDLNPEKVVSDGSNSFKLSNMTLSKIKGENLQSIFDETYDNYLDDVYRGKDRPKAQPETHSYTAPEVLKGADHSQTSDLWSLGCVLYEMFSGRQLFDERNPKILAQKILNDRFVLPTARGLIKPSIEFSSLLQALLNKDPSKRLDWYGVLTHPFWTGKLVHLIRPKTISNNKSLTSDLQDRPSTSRLATDRPESNVSFSLSCTKTSIQIVNPVKLDESEIKIHQQDKHQQHQTIPVEQSSAIINDNIDRLRKILFSKSELQLTQIAENQKIQKTLPFKYETKLLTFQSGKVENLSRLSSVELLEHVNLIRVQLTSNQNQQEKNANIIRTKLNLLNYIGCMCIEQTFFADTLINNEFHKDLLTMINHGPSLEL